MFVLSGNIQLTLAIQTILNHDLGQAVDRMSMAYNYPLVDRSAIFGGNAVFADKGTLASGFDQHYDFRLGGPFESLDGQVLRFDKVHAWAVQNRSTTAIITLGEDFSVFTDVTRLVIQPKGFICQTMPQGKAVGDVLLQIDNPGPGVADFDFVMIGTLNND